MMVYRKRLLLVEDSAKDPELIRISLGNVYMSGYTDDLLDRYGVSGNEINFLEKPFTAAALGQKVREVIDGGRRFKSQQQTGT